MYTTQPRPDTQENNRPAMKDHRRTLRKGSTPAEATLWQMLKKRQVLGVKFRRQFSVGPYILDFYSPEIKLCIELDGAGHYTPDGAEYDEARTKYLTQIHGIRVIRFENKQVFDSANGILHEIEETVREAIDASDKRKQDYPSSPPALRGTSEAEGVKEKMQGNPPST